MTTFCGIKIPVRLASRPRQANDKVIEHMKEKAILFIFGLPEPFLLSDARCRDKGRQPECYGQDLRLIKERSGLLTTRH